MDCGIQCHELQLHWITKAYSHKAIILALSFFGFFYCFMLFDESVGGVTTSMVTNNVGRHVTRKKFAGAIYCPRNDRYK